MHDELLLEVAVNLSMLTLQRHIANEGLNPLLVFSETLRKKKKNVWKVSIAIKVIVKKTDRFVE